MKIQAAVNEPHPKRKKVQEAPPQAQTQEATISDPKTLPQQVQRVERPVPLEQHVPQQQQVL